MGDKRWIRRFKSKYACVGAWFVAGLVMFIIGHTKHKESNREDGLGVLTVPTGAPFNAYDASAPAPFSERWPVTMGWTVPTTTSQPTSTIYDIPSEIPKIPPADSPFLVWSPSPPPSVARSLSRMPSVKAPSPYPSFVPDRVEPKMPPLEHASEAPTPVTSMEKSMSLGLETEKLLEEIGVESGDNPSASTADEATPTFSPSLRRDDAGSLEDQFPKGFDEDEFSFSLGLAEIFNVGQGDDAETSNNRAGNEDSEGTEEGNTERNEDGNTEGTEVGNTEGTEVGNTEGNDDGNTEGSSDGNTGTDDGNTEGTESTQGTDGNTEGNDDSSTEGNDDSSTGGNDDSSTEGTDDSNTGGTGDSNTGGTGDSSTEGNEDGNTDGIDDNTDGSDHNGDGNDEGNEGNFSSNDGNDEGNSGDSDDSNSNSDGTGDNNGNESSGNGDSPMETSLESSTQEALRPSSPPSPASPPDQPASGNAVPSPTPEEEKQISEKIPTPPLTNPDSTPPKEEGEAQTTQPPPPSIDELTEQLSLSFDFGFEIRVRQRRRRLRADAQSTSLQRVQ